MVGEVELLCELDILDECCRGRQAVELVLVLQVPRGELRGHQPVNGGAP